MNNDQVIFSGHQSYSRMTNEELNYIFDNQLSGWEEAEKELWKREIEDPRVREGLGL